MLHGSVTEVFNGGSQADLGSLEETQFQMKNARIEKLREDGTLYAKKKRDADFARI